MVFEVRQTARFIAWLQSLKDARARLRIAARLVRLEQGLFGDCKSVGDGIRELRIDHGPGYRAYFVQRGQVVLVLLCGGDKGSQDRDIAEAKALAKEL